jgi:hypothetical protein
MTARPLMLLDIVYLAVGAGALLGCWWFVTACDRL